MSFITRTMRRPIRPATAWTARNSAGFTLVELLTVIAIIAVLAAIIFPVFATAQGKARQITCISNLRQIGMAVQMYTQDYDGFLPYAKDASDACVPQIWPTACQNRLKQIPYLHAHTPDCKESLDIEPGVLDTYIKSREIWRCAGDTGFDYLDNNDSCNGPCYMKARPTMYQAFGASYLFRTEIAFRNLNLDTLTATTFDGTEVGPSGVNVLFDGNGSWHGSPFSLGRSGLRYNTLLADGHTKLLTDDQYQQAWGVILNRQSGRIADICQ